MCRIMTISFDNDGYVSKEWMANGRWRTEKKIGLSLSSGADSALLLYLMAKSLSEYPSKENKRILCWHGINTAVLAYNSHDVCVEIIKVIRNHFPDIIIELYSEVIQKDSNNVKLLRQPRGDYFEEQGVEYLTGSTTQFSNDILIKNNMQEQSDRSTPEASV